MNWDEFTMLFSILKIKWRVIAVICIISIIISGIAAKYFVEPKYQTYMTFIVRIPEDYEELDYTDILLNQQLLLTYGEIAKSKRCMRQVIENLDMDVTYEEFSQKLDIAIIDSTEILKVKVTDATPESVFEIAQEFAHVFVATVEEIRKEDNIHMLDNPELPSEPLNSNLLFYMMTACILGFMISSLILIVKDYLNNSVKGKWDIEKYTSLDVIGSIPKIKNNNLNFIYKNKGVVRFDSIASEAYRSIRTRLQYINSNEGTKTILLTSSIKGEGKSTVSINLAHTLSGLNKKVLLMDCDLREAETNDIDYHNMPGVSNILLGDVNIEDTIIKIDLGLHIIPPGPSIPNPAEILSGEKIKDVVESLKNMYDMIILDSPPTSYVTDPVILSLLVDGVILVCAERECKIGYLIESRNVLENMGQKSLV
jgi:succinoglycan biosynthesis transport protein ExoP